ncbi:hypothetical protein [Lactobacillus sp. Sy-1]|uniref:hypothetical protein n=1 Tax=Lactobacillus sp. Sy-1 TaxID=2109645 RepID=UPI001C59BA9D|nr:hypothetical protein [Lactobacillus sp. Sy-1]MBW1605764.1 hypothetical protein [Lactobacillus sp. Sy-1]
MKNRRGFMLADSLLALMIISGGIGLYSSVLRTFNTQLAVSRVRMEQSREKYEQIILEKARTEDRVHNR